MMDDSAWEDGPKRPPKASAEGMFAMLGILDIVWMYGADTDRGTFGKTRTELAGGW